MAMWCALHALTVMWSLVVDVTVEPNLPLHLALATWKLKRDLAHMRWNWHRLWVKRMHFQKLDAFSNEKRAALAGLVALALLLLLKPITCQ